MRYAGMILAIGVLAASGCYVVEYAYYPEDDGYYYSGEYYPQRTVVRYYSPLEPLVDLAILGAVLHGWGHWSPRYHRSVPSRYPSYRIRR